MSPLEQNLIRIGARITRWRAGEGARFGLAGLGACWAALALLDLWLRPRTTGRLTLSLVFLAAVAAAVAALAQMLRRRHSPAAVAALLERRFPQLDNHLINRVLFAATADIRSAWVRAYLAEPPPASWSDLPLGNLKNRYKRRLGAAALAVALLALLGPGYRYGEAWRVALRRVANPFSTLAPVTFTTVLQVAPGDATALQGDPVELVLRARGRAGQTVVLELAPADAARTLVRLGTFDATGVEQEFVHTLPRLTVPVVYRFTAGDAWPTA
ncbi:MAG: hypothetical protein GX590_07340, partial [Lentisphaerae bacterium]|nr:hypothetical protein [Lentisphaerota bacterium]